MVSKVATTTHVYSVWLPCRLSTMRGSALETTVLDSIATNIASRRPDMASSTSRWVMAPGLASGLVAGLVGPVAAPPERSGSVVVVDTEFLMQGVTVDLDNY